MKKFILLLLLFISTILIKAQYWPQNDVSKSCASAEEARAYDLDNDGDMDIVTASRRDNKIAWYKNDGNGNFGTQQIISNMVIQPQSVYAADINADGNLDIIAASAWGEISWYINDGNGNFSNKLIISGYAPQVNSISASDMDNDGDIDIVSAGEDVAWYPNDGFGNFSPKQTIQSYPFTQAYVYLSDLNGDGDMDVITSFEDEAKVVWHENLGGGTFGSEQIIKIFSGPFPTDEFYSVYSADIDGDGDNDVVTSSSVVDVEWFRNDGNGGFSTGITIINGVSGGVTTVSGADLDNDGDIDIFEGGDKLRWHINDGNGNFAPEQFVSGKIGFVVAADIDGDGKVDVITAEESQDKIAWHKNDGINIGGEQIISTSATNASSIYSCDLDNDGDKDILFSASFNGKIAWYENNGNGNFGALQMIDTVYSTVFASIYASDLDNDGDLDVLTIKNNTSKIVWYENDGNGNFGTSRVITSSIVNPTSIYSIDLNGDGNMDVLSASYNDDKIAWYENLGMGVFGPQNIISTSADGAIYVYADDLDGDGDMDVLSASNGDDKIAWYENLGGGVIDTNQHVISTVFNNLRSVYTSDLDGDGDMDVLSASWWDDKIAWYENDGMGNFGPQQIIAIDPNNAAASSVYASDMDGDGDMDVLSAFSNKIEWYENDGTGNFYTQTVSTMVNYALAVTAADIDGDGDMDILSASKDDDKIAWYENKYISNFQLKGKLFYDANQNANLDSNELGLNLVQTYLQPKSLINYTYNNGDYYFNTSDVTMTYTISYLQNPLWRLTTDSSTYTRTLTSFNPTADNLDFGFYPDTILSLINPILTGGFPRCNDTINYWINIANKGTTIPSGIIHLNLDNLVGYVSASLTPDSIIGQDIYWHYDSLFFLAEKKINLQVSMPSFTYMGSILSSILTVHKIDGNNITYSNVDTLNQILVCAYDPNDKTVSPVGSGVEGYISANQKLKYLIRFQNTGNDTAITITIKDQLNKNLDWRTLQPIASSHDMRISINQDGEATFNFENIMLPDSNVNEIASHGFVIFTIIPKNDLLPNTQIFNTAYIYFDNNPPVITNTVLNTIDDPTEESLFSDLNTAILYPNPFNNNINIYYKNEIETVYNIFLYDIKGSIIYKQENITTNTTMIDFSSLDKGIYILVGSDQSGTKLFSNRIIAQ